MWDSEEATQNPCRNVRHTEGRYSRSVPKCKTHWGSYSQSVPKCNAQWGSYSKSVPKCKAQWESYSQATHNPYWNVRHIQEATHKPYRNVRRSEKATHNPFRNVRHSEKAIHNSYRNVRHSKETTHNPYRNVRHGEEATHNPYRNVRYIQEATHKPCRNVWHREEATHNPFRNIWHRDEATHNPYRNVWHVEEATHNPYRNVRHSEEATHNPYRNNEHFVHYKTRYMKHESELHTATSINLILCYISNGRTKWHGYVRKKYIYIYSALTPKCHRKTSNLKQGSVRETTKECMRNKTSAVNLATQNHPKQITWRRKQDVTLQGYNVNTSFKKEVKDLCEIVEMSVRKYVYESSPSQPVGRTYQQWFARSDG